MTKIAFLFPGQGAQTVGMGRQVHDSCESARSLFRRAEQVLGYDLARICFDGPVETLNSTIHSQPALFVCSLAALEQWKAAEPEKASAAQAAAGLSLGEYTAMAFADVLDFETALGVVQRRGEAMQAASDATASGMVSILGMDAEPLAQLCEDCREEGEILQIANYLCPGNIVVSGHTTACERIAAAAPEAGAMKAMPLAVAGAFHTPIMDSAVTRLAEALSDAKLSKPRIPVVSNVDAQPHDDPEKIRELLIRQVVSPVRWEDSMRWLMGKGFDAFTEIGPGRVLRGLLKRIHRKTPCESVVC